jgi:predicted permease
MSNFLLLFISFAGGYYVKRISNIHRSQVSLLNSFILYISLPSQIFLYIPGMKFNTEFLAPICVSWIIFILAIPFFKFMGKNQNYSNKIILCLIMVCGLGNTSFVGLPLIENYFGNEGIGIGIYVDQFGTFLALSLIGFPFLLYQSNEDISVIASIKKVILFPPFISIVIALFMKLIDVTPPFSDVLKRLGDTLAPLALFSVGVQLSFSDLKGRGKIIILGLFYKLVLAPLIIYILFIQIFGISNLIGRVSVFEASMGPMITSTLLVSEKNIEGELASVLLAIGIISSFLTSYIWFKIL